MVCNAWQGSSFPLSRRFNLKGAPIPMMSALWFPALQLTALQNINLMWGIETVLSACILPIKHALLLESHPPLRIITWALYHA